MRIKVFNEDNIQKFKTKEKHIVVSIQDPTCDFVTLPANPNRLDWVGLHFYDFDGPQKQPNYDCFLFTSIQAKIILEFIEKWKDKIDLVCINCVAGRSRSIGVAAALSKIYNGDDTYFFKHYCPNMLVYRKIIERYYEGE